MYQVPISGSQIMHMTGKIPINHRGSDCVFHLIKYPVTLYSLNEI